MVDGHLREVWTNYKSFHDCGPDSSGPAKTQRSKVGLFRWSGQQRTRAAFCTSVVGLHAAASPLGSPPFLRASHSSHE